MNHDHFSDPNLFEGSDFRGFVYKSYNFNVKQQYFAPFCIHNFKFDFKFILLALARLQKDEVEDGASIDGSF